MERSRHGAEEDIRQDVKECGVEQGLRFGVSQHLHASYEWMATCFGSDKTGSYAGVPYDGNDAGMGYSAQSSSAAMSPFASAAAKSSSANLPCRFSSRFNRLRRIACRSPNVASCSRHLLRLLVQSSFIDAGALRQLSHPCFALNRTRHRFQLGKYRAQFHEPIAVRELRPILRQIFFEVEFRRRDGRVNATLHVHRICLRRLGRIFEPLNRRHPHGKIVLFGEVNRTLRCVRSGRVAIEVDDKRVRKPPEPRR